MHSLMHNCTQLTATTRGGVRRGEMVKADRDCANGDAGNCQSFGGGRGTTICQNQNGRKNKRETTAKPQNNFDPDINTMFGFVIDTSIYRIPNIFVYSNRALSKYSSTGAPSWLDSPRTHTRICSDFLFMSPQNATRERFSSAKAADHVVCLNF